MRDETARQVHGLLAGLVLVTTLFAASSVFGQGTKIGFINSARIENESVPFQRAAEAMKKEFQPREQQMQTLQKQIVADQERFEKERLKLSPTEQQARASALAERMRKSDQAVYALAQDIESRKNERAAKLLEEVNAA